MLEQEIFHSHDVNHEERKKIHIPMHDVDDLAFKNRHDPNFVASITNLMQVPATITLNNGNLQRSYNQYIDKTSFPMDIPEKLTADGILRSRYDVESPSDSIFDDDYKDPNDANNTTTATPPSTPTKVSFIDKNEEEKFSKTPQIAADLFKRMKPRRSSIEVDLHAEIRILRDKINNLEHECQVNSRSCKFFYAILCGYVIIKTFTWLVKSN